MKTKTSEILQLAEKLQTQKTNTEKNPFSDRLKTIIEVPESKYFLIQMMDVAFRSKNYQKIANHIIHLLKTHKNYQALFTSFENVMLKSFTVVGKIIPSISVAIMLKKILATSSDVVFFINSNKFKKDTTTIKVFGNPWEFATEIGPLAVSISEKLKHVIQNTPDNQWLVKPRLNGNHMLSPGIIWGVGTEDYPYQNELFGPIVSVLKATDLKNAVEIANNVEYGLITGLESLDDNEIEYWNEHIEAGNKYVNRSTTGAIVQRQPFGGIKASCFGAGMKAGGINYVLQFTNINSKTTDWKKDYQKWYDELFSKK